MSESLRRREFEQKQAFHNTTLFAPYFISSTPTKTLALNHLPQNLPIPTPSIHFKLYYSLPSVHKTTLLTFSSLKHSTSFYNAYQEQLKNNKQKIWCEYCKDLTQMAGILYQSGRVYVSFVQNKQFKAFVHEISQLVIAQGAAIEHLMKKNQNKLYRFLDEVVRHQVSIRRAKNIYITGGGSTPTYKATATNTIAPHPSKYYHMDPNGSIHRAYLNPTQRKYFTQLLFNLTRSKKSIQEAMAFCIFNIHAAVQIVIIIMLEIFQQLKEDYIRYFYLISDILFNTTTQNYRRLFARMIPFVFYFLAKQSQKNQELNITASDKYKGQLKALVQIWEIKFIFDENYTKGLLFLLKYYENKQIQVSKIHEKLKAVGELEDQRDCQMQLEQLCFDNGIPLVQNSRQETLKIINEYLWQSTPQQNVEPQPDQIEDGEPLNDKDLLKIKNKQVKVVCCEGLNVNMLLEKNWQTRSKAMHSNSVDST